VCNTVEERRFSAAISRPFPKRHTAVRNKAWEEPRVYSCRKSPSQSGTQPSEIRLGKGPTSVGPY
jgi:hypothetical protein